MNRVLLDSKNKIRDNEYYIDQKETIDHITNVLKKSESDEIKITLLDECLADAQIVTKEQNRIKLKILEKYPGSTPWYNLYVALSRPHTCQKIIEFASSSGVNKVIFFKSENSHDSYLNSKLFRNENYLHYILKGLSQSKYYFQIPQVFVEQSAPKLPANSIYLDHSSANRMFYPDNKLLNLFIGPEQGWTLNEIEKFKKNNIKGVKISESILRVEVACIYALAQLEFLKPPIHSFSAQ